MRLIDADELIEAIDNQDNWLSQMDLAQFNIYSLINTMPIVERPQGEWLHPYVTDIACECSICHLQMPITDYFNFCPNCGADMRKEAEND